MQRVRLHVIVYDHADKCSSFFMRLPSTGYSSKPIVMEYDLSLWNGKGDAF